VLPGIPRKRKLAMTPELLVRMRRCRKNRWCDPRMKVVWAAMLLAFFTISRKDNFSVDKVDAFNPRKHLTRGDVKVLKSGVHCTFRRSKTNQFGSRVHQVFALAAPVGTILDPKAAVEEAFAVALRARLSDPAFLLPSANGLDPLTHYVFVGSVKHCVQQVGLDPNGYSGHSFRRGGATLAHRLLGIDPLLIKRMGDWSSDAYMDYIDPHTPEGLVSLPVAMTRCTARLECLWTAAHVRMGG
jgi:integrase